MCGGICAVADAAVQVVQHFLRPLQREGGNDHVAMAGHGFADGAIQLVDGVGQRAVRAVAIGGFHHHVVGGRRGDRIAQDRSPRVALVAGKQQSAARAAFAQGQQDRGRTEDVAGVEELRLDAGRDADGFVVAHRLAEEVQRVQRVVHGVQRFHRGLVAAPTAALGTAGVLFLQAGGVEHHDAGQVAAGGGGEDAPAEALAHQSRNAAAVIEMRVREQQHVDVGGIEAERRAVGLFLFAAALEQAAVDQDAAAVPFDQVARAGDLFGRAVTAVADAGAHGLPRRWRLPVGTLVLHEQRQRRVFQHPARGAAEHAFAQPRVAVGTHHQQVGVMLARGLEQVFAGARR